MVNFFSMNGEIDRLKPNLVYTVALDERGHGGTRQMAKMLASSLVRTYWGGEVRVFRNTELPLFFVARAGLEEIQIEGTDLRGQELANHAMEWKPKVRQWIDGRQFGWVMFLDADCLALRNLDHLFQDVEADILYQPERGRSIHDGVFCGYLTRSERGITLPQEAKAKPLCRDGINSGTWAVRGEIYAEVMEEWERLMERMPNGEITWREQSAWNRLILDAADHGWRAKPFEAHEVQFPLHLDKDWKKYKEAAILHMVGGTPKEKIEFMFGQFMGRFLGDPGITLLNLMDM